MSSVKAFAYGPRITTYHFIIQKSSRIQAECCRAFGLNVTEALMPVHITHVTAKARNCFPFQLQLFSKLQRFSHSDRFFRNILLFHG
mgnify:CR=1 FL=1